MNATRFISRKYSVIIIILVFLFIGSVASEKIDDPHTISFKKDYLNHRR